MKSNIDATKTVSPPPVTRAAWPRPAYLPLGPARSLHRMAWRDVGWADGEPWLLLHGGPGSSCQPGMLRPFDLSRQRVVAPDQRGCGASLPRGRTAGNHTAALVSDMEALREHLELERWSVLAGSWGTVVALAYAQAHPERVKRLVLRGAFALRRCEVGGLLQPSPGVTRSLGAEPHWPTAAGHALPPLLARLKQLLQSGTPSVASLRVLRRWNLLETEAAGRGMRRSLRHAMQAPGLQQPVLAAAIRRGWGALQRQQRRAQAQVKRLRMNQADRRALNKFRIQSHYLLHRGFVRPGGLDRAVLSLAQQGVAVDWVHGRFDAICPPANSRRWVSLGQHTAPGSATLTGPCSGHLGHEPDMLSALRARVRSSV